MAGVVYYYTIGSYTVQEEGEEEKEKDDDDLQENITFYMLSWAGYLFS